MLILKTARIEVNDEPWVHRLISHAVSGREDAFLEGIRARDGKCVITGVVNRAAYLGDWTRFETAHIFPLEKENLWLEWDFGQWITDMDGTNGVSKSTLAGMDCVFVATSTALLISTCCR